MLTEGECPTCGKTRIIPDFPVSRVKNRILRRITLVVTIPVMLGLHIPLCAIGVAIWWWRVLTGMVTSFARVWAL